MKQKNLHTMAFALAMIIFSGCGKTVPQSEPTNINQAMLIEKSAQEQESYTFPETFTGDWTSQQGRLTIHADAKVVAEQGTPAELEAKDSIYRHMKATQMEAAGWTL